MNTQQQQGFSEALKAKRFSEALKAKLAAEGFTIVEQQQGALMAEMQALMQMIADPRTPRVLTLACMTRTMAKVMATLTEAKQTQPERIIAASDIILDAATEKARILANEAQEAPTAEQSVDPKQVN